MVYLKNILEPILIYVVCLTILYYGIEYKKNKIKSDGTIKKKKKNTII